MRSKPVMTFLCTGLLAGCASTAAPAERLANSQGSLRAAEEISADKVPQAALYMQLAREEIAKAKKLMADDDNMRADWVLRRAEADAALALALAKSEPEVAKATALKEQLNTIKPQPASPDKSQASPDAPKTEGTPAAPAAH